MLILTTSLRSPLTSRADHRTPSSVRAVSPFRLFALSILILLFPIVLLAQGTISGYITDRETGDSLAGVSIRVEGTRLGAISNSRGRFTIKNVPLGQVEMKATLVGYESETVRTYLGKDGQVNVVFTMLASSFQKDEVVVSAGRRVQAVQDVPISVSALSQQDLAQRGITQLDQALRYVSGVSVVGDQVNIRGSSGFAFGVGSRTMVLLDGLPLLSGDNGDIKFDVLPVSDVQRIEIVKGAGSALYGTGALGGVVSLFTSTPTEQLTLHGRVYGGLYTQSRHDEWRYRDSPPSNWGADVKAAQKFGDVSINLSGGIRSDESYRDFDRQLRGFGYGKVMWTPTELSKLTLSTFYAQADAQNFIYWKDLRNATRPPDVQNRDERLWTAKLAAALEYNVTLDNRTSIVIRPGLFRTRYENRIGDSTLDSNQSTAYAYNVDAMVTTSFSDRFTLTGGLNGKLNNVVSDVYGEQLQSIISAFAQAEVILPYSIIATLGVRVDREETQSLPSQLEFSPKLGLSWEATPSLHLRASVGRGFRAATIAERYANIRYGPFEVKPNPDIRPEYSWSAEIGARFTPKNWILPIEFDWALFDNELYDLIEPTFDMSDPSIPIYFRNVTRARILGTELTVRAMLTKGLGVESGITAMLPQDLILDETLKYRNNILWYTRGTYQVALGTWHLEFQAEYRFQNRVENIDDRLALFIPDADQRVPSHVIDARVFLDLKPLIGQPLRVGVLGQNLLDYYYAEMVANLSPTRSVLLQIEYR